MTLPLLVRRSLRQHAFSSAICVVALALAGGLLMSVWTLKSGARQAFDEAGSSFDGVLGARGSKLQLVLNAVFHLDESPGNVAAEDYESIRRHPAVEIAIPIALGDNYRGYRIVGTVTNLFTEVEVRPGKRHRVRSPGRWFDSARREAVIGSVVADRLGLRLGDSFRPYHGLTFHEDHEHEEEFLVVGVLEPSNTPADRILWVPLAGVQHMSGHDPAHATEVSAVLVRFRPQSLAAGQQLDRQYNREGTHLTFAWPIARIVASFFDRVAWIEKVLVLVAWLVAVVAAATILTTLYGSLSERRRDLAILRALGAHRRTIFGLLLLEAATLSALGVIGALGVHAVIHAVAGSVIRAQTGMVLDPLAAGVALVGIAALVIVLGVLAGLAPAVKAYRTEVASHLAPLA
jgi:putative ABC transport system permease protein